MGLKEWEWEAGLMYLHGPLGKNNHSSIYAGNRMSKAARYLYIDDFAQYPINGP
jgi:hypothetical protein